MLKYFVKYESLSAARLKTFSFILGLNLCLLKFLLVLAKLALLSSGLN